MWGKGARRCVVRAWLGQCQQGAGKNGRRGYRAQIDLLLQPLAYLFPPYAYRPISVMYVIVLSNF